jgi:hypothetical protein
MLNNLFWFTGNNNNKKNGEGNMNVRSNRNQNRRNNVDIDNILNNVGDMGNNKAKRVRFNENEMNQLDKIDELSRELKKLERGPIQLNNNEREADLNNILEFNKMMKPSGRITRGRIIRRNTPHPRGVQMRRKRVTVPKLPKMNSENREIMRMDKLLNNFEKKYKKIKQLEENVETCKKEKEKMIQYQKQLRHYKERITQLETIISRMAKIIRH